jgi:hypothetical protein
MRQSHKTELYRSVSRIDISEPHFLQIIIIHTAKIIPQPTIFSNKAFPYDDSIYNIPAESHECMQGGLLGTDSTAK